MQKFRFPLARVLEYRQLESAREKEKLSVLAAERAGIVQKLEQVFEERRRSLGAPATAGAELLVAELASRRQYAGFLDRVEAHVRNEIARVDEAIAAQRLVLVEAERRCSLLEKLRDKRLAEWQSAVDHELEELAADAHRAKMHSERAEATRRTQEPLAW